MVWVICFKRIHLRISLRVVFLNPSFEDYPLFGEWSHGQIQELRLLSKRSHSLPPFTFGLENVIRCLDREGSKTRDDSFVGWGREEIGIGKEMKLFRRRLE